MSKIYPLEWLDSLVLQTFNPDKTNIGTLSDTDLSLISDNVLKEFQKIQLELKNQIFSLRKTRQIRLLVRKYHSTLIFLLDRIIENQKNEMFKGSSLSNIIKSIIANLDELLCFVENRFPYYLNLDERVSITYLMVWKAELDVKLNNLRKKKFYCEFDKNSIEIVIEVLSKCIEEGSESRMTYRKIIYQREFLKNLELFISLQESPVIFSSLDQWLIGMNFNSLNYINYVIERIVDHLTAQMKFSNKINTLILYYKEFSQLHYNEKITFDPDQQNVKYALDNWFRHEIAFLERQIDLASTVESNAVSKLEGRVDSGDKVECVLSIDQMGLILRAIDEAKVMKARSMSHLFKTIVPHLCTAQKSELSFDSMRTKSYCPEQRDKDVAIRTLESLIKHIEEF